MWHEIFVASYSHEFQKEFKISPKMEYMDGIVLQMVSYKITELRTRALIGRQVRLDENM